MNPIAKLIRHFSYPFKTRVRAGVLQLTLGIAVIVAAMCSSIILLAYYARLSILRTEIRSTLNDNAESGIQYLMARRNDLPFYQSEQIDLFGEGIDSVRMSRKPWGLFELFNSYAFRGNNHYSKTALVTATSGETVSSLYVPESNSPLYLAGKTEITGIVYVSERKFTTGYVNGRGFEGIKLLRGEFRRSEDRMPYLDTTLLEFAKQWKSGVAFKTQRVNVLNNFSGSAIFSFSNDSVNCYSSNGPLELSDTLQGNLVIYSSVSILVTAKSILSDVLVIAPEIIIESGFKGNAQFFADRFITVQENVILQYPSSLSLIGQSTDSLITISKNARVEGIVIIQGYDQNKESRGVLSIKRGGVLHGIAYINGAADIQGSLWGHLTAKRVQASVQGSIYNNHLLDAEINYSKKSADMPASLLWGGGKKITIARWID